MTKLLASILLLGSVYSPAPTPSDLGCNVWYEGELGVTVVTGVSSWTDEGGSAGNLVQIATTKQPAVVSNHFNGIDGIQGDGSDDILSTSAAYSLTGDFSIFTVVEFATLASNQNILSTDADNFTRVGTTGIGIIKIAGTQKNLTATSAFTTSTRYLIEFHRDGSDNLTIFRNGTNVTSGTPSQSGTLTIQNIGARNDGQGHGTTIYGAIAACDDQVTGAKLTYVQDHFQPYLD